MFQKVPAIVRTHGLAGLVRKIIAHVLWNTGLGLRLDRAIWTRVDAGPGISFLFFKERDVFANIPARFSDQEFSEFIRKNSARWSRQQEAVLLLENAIVEPGRCLAVLPPNRLVAQSAILETHYPGVSARFKINKPFTRLDCAVLYDGSASRNYFHHFVDAVNRLHALDKISLPSGIPFLINRASYDSIYFQHLLERSAYFRSLNWTVQEPSEWYHVRQLYRPQSIWFEREPWEKTRQLYGVQPKLGRRRIFLSRDSSRYTRALNNEVEIATVLQSFGFDTLYAEHLTLDEQIAVFQDSEYIVALHGAGLVQQVFTNSQTAHILELMPRDYLMPLYYWQAYALGAKYYDAVVGGEMDRRGNYAVDPRAVERAIIRMLESTTSGRTYGLEVVTTNPNV
jgi:hypothetical protein